MVVYQSLGIFKTGQVERLNIGMRATEFIRDILDLIDKIDCASDDTVEVQSDAERAADQVADLVSTTMYTTAPNEQYADITAVTTAAGGGINGPKHPADIRASTQAMYPGKVYGAR